ncbi:S-layer homology domain-containing protein [Dysosmobacter sp.]|uniref:S-layer homology domain-containing protein n=1 Tax=Dysosmobacter sp. TaxID=2591382 RepID=UPI00307B58E1
MKRRILSSLMALVLCLTLLPAAAYAAGGTAVYVSSSGNDGTGDGSADKPFATLAKAVDVAKDGATIYVMSDLNMTSCARFYNKSLTITSLGDATCTITRGDNFAQQQDNARSWYNPAMVEVQTTGGVGAGLTLTNIIFDDAGKKEGTVFAQAVSDGSVGAASNDNLVYVQDAIIASNATVTTTITLGDGAVLRNFGGMSAVRATGEAKLVMEPGSVIEDASSITRSKGDAGSVGPAGAVWLQGSDFEMENGAEIKNVNGRAVYADGGSVSVGGTISGIIGNPAMWQGKDGTAIHLRGSAKATLNGKISDCTEGVLVFVDKAVFEMATGSFLGNSDAAGIKTNEDPTWSLVNKDDYGTDRNTITIHGEISGIKNNKTPIQFKFGTLLIGADSNIHHNSVFYGTLYIQRDAIVDIYGKINNNDASSRGGGVATAGHGEVVINMYEGAEVKGNTAVKNGGGIMISSNTSFTMYGGEISGNVSQTVGGGIYQYKNNSKVELQGGTIRDNTMNATDVKDSSTGTENDITISNQGNGSSNHYLYISQNTELDNQNVYFQINSTTVTPAENSLDIKLGNASKESVTALSGKADANGWNAPLATFWAQRDGAAELTVGGLTFNKALPVYALVQETGADGKPVSGAEVRVYSTKITDDGIRLTLPNGYTNGCAVALAQPTTDFGSVGISGPTEIAKTSDAAPYEVPYTVTYTMSDSLRGMLNMASADIPAMSFVVELDSRLAAKTGDSGNCLYTFDGDGILDGTASVSGHTVTVTCTPLPGWKAAIAGKSSVKMVLKCAGLLDAAAFAAGESLNTAAHISGKVSSGSTVTSVVIPSSICRTRMTAQTYTVTYHRNGADSGETVDSRSYIFGDLAVVSENGYVRDGHSFVGWNTQRDGSGTHHVPGSSITVTDHIHLYAQWTRNSSGDDDDTGYTLRLTKLDAGDGTPLSGAKFELWRVGTRSDTRLGVYETNRYGWTQAEVSQSGDYYWVETVPPEGYRLGGGKHPTNTGKNSRITVYNTEAAVPALFTDDHYAYIVGGPDGTVRPNDSMTRAGVATIFFRLLKDSVRDANLLTGCTYTDVPDGHWANTAISTMTGLDIVRGYDAAAFGPGDPITRAQFAAICARFDTGKSNGSRTFSDIEGHWAKAYIERAAELGWISGFQDGTFRPDAYITRAQAVTMINRMLNRVPEDPSDLLPGMNVWPDCGPGDWFYLAIQEATNSHDYRRKAGSYETWTDLNANPDWTRYEN